MQAVVGELAMEIRRQKEEFATELRRQGEENKAQFISFLQTSGLVLVSLSIWVVDPFGVKHRVMPIPSSPKASSPENVPESTFIVN